MLPFIKLIADKKPNEVQKTLDGAKKQWEAFKAAERQKLAPPATKPSASAPKAHSESKKKSKD